MSFEQLGLQAELLSAISAQGYTTPTPIQAQSIPVVLEGRDVLAGAQTGTGKTAAFTLPILQMLNSRAGKSRAPRALVITPTRELAAQIGESVETYGKNLHLRSTVVFGGVGINPQKDRLRRGVDILVATPGRLLDHAGQRTVNLSQIEILVLDEADRMLDMGFIHDIKRVIKLLPAKRQNLLFSATYNEDIKRLASGLLHNPEFIAVARDNEATELVTQVIHPVGKARKRELLTHLINEGDWSQVLVFNRTKHGSNKLVKQLETDGISATAIHGNKSQAARTKALADFKKGKVRVLVATDIAARGLDIDRLPHVVNYDLPNVAEDYVHRIGRTGRAGSEGAALSLVCADERGLLADINRLLGHKIPVEEIPGFKQETSPAQRPNAGAARHDSHGRRRQAAASNSRKTQSRQGRGGRPGARSEARSDRSENRSEGRRR
ncbi:ATP-dependent RNA helicase RhlE [hydrothermal vent metagenome]|uniref:ATP-dependent RNA helicase RhlE n=1 Tax=hydrothermal vent metagenome TaxID=652676 RepID=A0A3B0R281_9ZZZZ